MRSQLSEATARHLVILGTPIVLITGGLIAFQIGGYGLASLVLGVVTLALLILSWLFRPRWWGSTRVQAISITVLGGIAMVVVTDELWLASIAAFYQRLQEAFPEALPGIDFPASLTFQNRLWVLEVLGGLFVILNYIWGRQQTLPPPNVAPADAAPFGEKEYEQLRDEYCAYMRRQLDLYDIDLNWSDTDYTTLEAEVEVDRQGKRSPRVERDLVRAIRRDRTTRAFLLLGEPGSGKSVSLRRLCRKLYGEVEKTGVVPVYINLREWDSPADPTDEQLSSFIRSHLKRSAGIAGKRFLDRWYEPMLAAGRFFFLLDSFDEMPAVLDCDDASPRIKETSRAFDRFFHDIHQCRGVLASRRFRQPRGFQGRRMSIRPLKESQIRQTMSRWLSGQPFKTADIIRELFRERPELLPVVRNPFLADLTCQYLILNDGKLPLNQFAIYDTYIRQRLSDSDAYLRELGLAQDDLLDAATQIARTIYDDPTIGLEVDVTRIGDWIPELNLVSVLQALRLTRLVRLGEEHARRFSFVHRRFAEFFVVRSLIEGDQPIPFESIPKDSRWRDCLVVYFGIAPEDQVQPIADYCWQVIKEQGAVLDDEGFRAAARPVIHTLRFLRDAFVARPELIGAFRPQLEECVLRWIRSPNILVAKIATECLGLLRPEAYSEGVLAAFQRQSTWLRESALIASRYVDASLAPEVLKHIRIFVRTLPSHILIGTYKDLTFSLSLSESLECQRQGLKRDIGCLAMLWFFVVPWTVWLAANLGVTLLAEWFFLLGVGGIALLLEPFLAISNDNYSRLGFDTSLRVAISMTFLFFTAIEVVYASDSILIGLILIVLPWEAWPGAIRSLGNVRKYPLNSALTVLLLGVVTSSIYLEGRIDSYISSKFPVKGILFDILGILVSSVLLALLLYGVLKVAWATVIATSHLLLCIKGLAQDRLVLKSLQIPSTITYSWIYRACRNLFRNQNRHKLLEILRLRQVEVTGAPIPLPDEEWVDDGVREGMARLESMWLGLDE